jgi:hypothetical protein
MLVESDVVDTVCGHLSSLGYTIHQRLPPTKQGVDIIASRPEHPKELWIESEGETSEREGSKRFGVPFDSAQVNIHVAEAVYTAVKHLANIPSGKDRTICIALPSNELHRKYADAVSPVLTRLGIVILWVHKDKSVTITPESSLSKAGNTNT